MKIQIPKDWETIDLLIEQDPNKFGEALRNYCFVGNCMQRGCYDTFELMPHLKRVTSGKIFNEAKEIIKPEFIESLYVFYFKLHEHNCYLDDDEYNIKICEPYEIVCAWEWNGDCTIYFRFNNRKVINTDGKKDYGWEWVK
jgi:hypothetical protein